jgi:hypothetical protein
MVVDRNTFFCWRLVVVDKSSDPFDND